VYSQQVKLASVGKTVMPYMAHY